MHEDPTPRDDARAAPDASGDAEGAPLEVTVDVTVADGAATVAAAGATADEDALRSEETIGETGRTLEELSAYFDRGRTPRIAAFEHDAEAKALLDSMERLDRLSRTMADEDAAAAGDADEQWLDGLLHVIRSEVRAGRDLPIEDPDERTSTTITEGALREVARAAGDAVDDVLVGSVRLTEHDGTLDVRVTIGVRYGAAMLPTASDVRTAVHRALVSHAPMTVGTVDVVVDDVLLGGAS